MISEKELERRYAALREAMSDAGYRTLVVAGGSDFSMRGYVRYVSDWRLFGGTAYVAFPLDGEPVSVLGPGAQAEWAKALSAIEDTRAVMDKPAEIVEVLQSRGLSRSSVGVVGLNSIMPYGAAKRLEAALPGAELEDATRLMQDVMAVLSEEEVAMAEETHSYLVQILDRIEGALAPGRTGREVMAEGIHTAAQLGCLDGMAHVSTREASGTRPGTERPFDVNDIVKVFLEYAGPNGFLIELGGTFSFVDPPEWKRRKFLTVVKAMERAAKLMCPGRRAGELCEVIEQTYLDDGWNVTGRRLWDFHGQGLNSLLPPIGMPGSDEILKENMMLNIHPGILTEDGWGASVTHNYFVTPDGGRPLGGFEPTWHVLSR